MEAICETCNNSKETKPMHFLWKNGVYGLKDPEFGHLMIKEHLGMEVPEGITDFQICMDCQEVVTETPEDVSKYGKLINDILRDIVITNVETHEKKLEDKINDIH